MIQLYSFGKNLGVADPSPFVLKVDAYLRMADIEFKHVSRPSNIANSPKGKLPFIKDGKDIIGDSQLIIRHFENKYNGKLNSHLNAEQNAIAYLVTKSLDENLYFCLLHSRWIREDTWPTIKQAFFSRLPFPLKLFLPMVLKRNIIKSIHAHGLNRHSEEEIKQICQHTFQALSDLLAEKKYFFGHTPSSLDATAFGFLAQFILVNIDNPYNQIARGFNNLTQYCQRINQTYYN